ncbi:MAG: hypothetical protein WC718_16290 [Phycisphaerales bacterium]|jgi:hypothetical protein
MHCFFTLACVAAAATAAQAQSFNLQANWSENANPNGPWSLTQNSILLPHVASWQQQLGGWAVAQPAYAKSQDGVDRLPMFMLSNGSETFAHDWTAGKVVVHTTDGFNGVGSGVAAINFTVPYYSLYSIHGGIWIGRDIGRTVDWRLSMNGAIMTGGALASGDPYSSLNPFSFDAGSGGPGALSGAASAGDVISLTLPTRGGSPGDFVVIDLTIDLQRLCDADINQDGNTDQGDVDYLINVIAGGPNPLDVDPDFNQDGNADQGDIDAIINAIAGGGCS